MAKHFQKAVSVDRIAEIKALQRAEAITGTANEPTVFKTEEIEHIPIECLKENPFQPRKVFSEESLNELAANIERFGLLLPIITRPNGDGTSTVIAGHRRWMACRKVGHKTIKAVQREATDQELQLLAVIENVQRDDLHAVDKARAFSEIALGYPNQDQAAEMVGMKRSAFSHWVRMATELSPEVLQVCAQIRTMSLNGLMKIAKLPVGRRLAAARKLLTLSQPVQKEEAPAGPKPRKIQNKRLFEVRNPKHGFALVVNIHAKSRKHQMTTEDIREALLDVLKNLDDQNC